MTVTRIVDPLALPEPERARLHRALAASRLSDLRPRAVVEPLVVAAACLTALLVLVVRNLGVLPYHTGQHGPGVVVVWALGLFGLALSLLFARRAHHLRGLPQGRALTSGELLDLRGTLVRVHGLEHLEEIREPRRDPGPVLYGADTLMPLKLCFSDGSFVVFHVQRHERAAVLADLEATAERLRDAYARNDRATIERLQLFPDLPPAPGGEGPFRAAPTTERFEPPRPRRTQALLAAAVACLAPFGWWTRNAVSDELSFRRALRENDVAAWLAYVEGEPRRVDEARREHLPRARLRQARRHGIDGLRSFLRLYGDTAVADEASAELRRLLAREGPL